MKSRYFAASLFAFVLVLVSLSESAGAKDLGVPALPPPVLADGKASMSEIETGPVSDGQINMIATSVKAQIIAEMRRDGVLPEASAPQIWEQQLHPQLNFLDLTGYFRTQGQFLYRCDLGTYIPADRTGTSSCAPPINYYPRSTDEIEEYPSEDHSLFAMDMKLRIDPTLNVSEHIRIKGTVNVFNGLIYGSTPDYMAGGDQANPSHPISFLTDSQSAPVVGINSRHGSIEVERVWGEVQAPFGEFRFGRMPLNFGLGILYGNGNAIDANHSGTSIDALMLATQIFGHYVIPAYAVSFSGPTGRGGGLGLNGDQGRHYFPGESGRRISLDPSNNVHSLFLIIGKQNSPLSLRQKIEDSGVVWNYGLLSSYRFQKFDALAFKVGNETNAELRDRQVERNAHAGIASIYVGVEYKTLTIELEAAGTVGRIGDSEGLNWAAGNPPGPIFILNGGAALKSRYGLFNDKLGLGFNSGLASGDPKSSINGREGLRSAMFSDNNATLSTFKFNPNYTVDLLLFRQVLGTVAGATYLNPHVSYDIGSDFSLRGDVVSAFALFGSSTSGNSSLLGLEFDLSATYHTAGGFYLRTQYGLLVPFGALNQPPALKSRAEVYEKYGSAQTAQTVQVLAGIQF